jgi:hypothetical protein
MTALLDLRHRSRPPIQPDPSARPSAAIRGTLSCEACCDQLGGCVPAQELVKRRYVAGGRAHRLDHGRPGLFRSLISESLAQPTGPPLSLSLHGPEGSRAVTAWDDLRERGSILRGHLLRPGGSRRHGLPVQRTWCSSPAATRSSARRRLLPAQRKQALHAACGELSVARVCGRDTWFVGIAVLGSDRGGASPIVPKEVGRAGL